MSLNQPNINDSEVNDGRREILEAYARGTDDSIDGGKGKAGAEVDRYGFICKTRPAASTKEEIDRECALQVKWLEMLNKWDKVFPSSKIRKLIFKGLPNSLRGEVWKRILETPKLIKANENKYENLRYQGVKTSFDLKQIDLDINRTYRDHVMFSQRYSLKQRSLFNVLTASTVYNSEVGYCQGMSSVAALVLMYMDEEDSFWALSTLLTGQKHTMHGFFIAGFPKLMRFQAHHAKILRKMLPSLSDHFERQGIMSSLYTLKWYMQCFLDRLPFFLILRLWDVFVLEGDKILHPIGYTLLKLHKRKLLKMQMDELAQFLSSGMEDLQYDADAFMDMLLNNVEELKKNNLYPAPSVVKGELPSDCSSTLNPREGSYNLVLKRISGDITTNNFDEDCLSHVSAPECEILDDLTRNSSSVANSNVRYRGLPPGIPLPPTYAAPIPSVLSFSKSSGRVSLISENLSVFSKASALSTLDSFSEGRTASYYIQKSNPESSKYKNLSNSAMVTRKLENIEIVYSDAESTESDGSKTRDSRNSKE